MSAASAEIITIGTELLLGQIVDTNTATIARSLRDEGISLFRTTTVGDNRARIAAAIKRALENTQIVITTGGLGPTVDDVTRQAIADSLEVDLQFHAELWQQIEQRFARYGAVPGENNRRQAHLPQGAVAIENPVGTAPAFRMQAGDAVVIALPGVPAEMVHLLQQEVLPFLRRQFDLQGRIHTRLLRVVGMGESSLDELIGDLETLQNPTVGVSAHPGRVDVRLAARSDDPAEAAQMLDDLESDLRQRLGASLYGREGDTLEAVTLAAVAQRGGSLVSVEAGSAGALAAALSAAPGPYLEGRVLPASTAWDRAEAALRDLLDARGAQFGLLLWQDEAEQVVHCRMKLHQPQGERSLERDYGGPPATSADWGVSLALDLLRRELDQSL